MLCFVHIPKTAGSAFREALIRLLGEDEIYWIGSPAHPVEEWRNISSSELSRYKVIGGHAGYRRLRAKCPQATFATLLREPVRRAVSFFEYKRSERNGNLARQLHSLDLLSAINTVTEFRERISNLQCRTISGASSFEKAEREIENGDWMIEIDANIDLLLRRISKRFGWPEIKSQQKNVSAPGYFQELCTAEAAETIRNLNREDLQLFEKYSAQTNS